MRKKRKNITTTEKKQMLSSPKHSFYYEYYYYVCVYISRFKARSFGCVVLKLLFLVEKKRLRMKDFNKYYEVFYLHRTKAGKRFFLFSRALSLSLALAQTHAHSLSLSFSLVIVRTVS